MAKRVSLRERRAGDAKGIDALFQGAESLESEGATEVGGQTDTSPTQVAPLPAPNANTKPVLAKVTIYIRPEQVIAVEAIQLAERQRTGQKPDKSDLLQEALDLLIAKYALP